MAFPLSVYFQSLFFRQLTPSRFRRRRPASSAVEGSEKNAFGVVHQPTLEPRCNRKAGVTDSLPPGNGQPAGAKNQTHCCK